MKPQPSGPAPTPAFVRTAVWANLILLLIAMVAPRMIAVNSAGSGGAVSAVLLFALPMAAILAISSVVVIRAFILARREDLRMRWTAYLPLSVFLLGIASTLLLVYATTV